MNPPIPPIPPIARVEILWSEHERITPAVYRSLAGADLAVAHALRQVPPPDEGYDKTEFRIVWTDGHAATLRADINARLVRAAAGVGVLRHHALSHARYLQSPRAAQIASARGTDPDVEKEAGAELARRIEREAAPWLSQRNAVPSRAHPTLLPDPVAAVDALRDRWAHRRGTARPTGAWADGAPDALRLLPHPATTPGDLRQIVRVLSLAIGHDLSRMPPDIGRALWDDWRAIVDGVDLLLRANPGARAYVDNEGFWSRVLPTFAARLGAGLGLRNRAAASAGVRLRFRPVGVSGAPYPAWLRALQDRAGVYVLRELQPDGTTPIVYVGMSEGRLYDTITRHLQRWRRAESHRWRGQFVESEHDPGLTYDRARTLVAVIPTAPADARDVELATIAALHPRDNIDGATVRDDDIARDDADAVPF